MIKLILGSMGRYWVLIASIVLIGAVTLQFNMIVERNQTINSLHIAARMLNQQLVEHQVKAALVDKLRRAMHIETVTLRDTLRERQASTTKSTEAIMLQPVSRKEYESIQWLHESIKELNFGANR